MFIRQMGANREKLLRELKKNVLLRALLVKMATQSILLFGSLDIAVLLITIGIFEPRIFISNISNFLFISTNSFHRRCRPRGDQDVQVERTVSIIAISILCLTLGQGLSVYLILPKSVQTLRHEKVAGK